MKTASHLFASLAGTLAVFVSHATAQTSAAPPTIVSHPASQTVAAGNRVVFAITTHGALTYQWFKDGRPIANTVVPALVIDSAGKDDAGSYHVEAANTAGRTASNPAILAVKPLYVAALEPPMITAQPSSVTADPGATATFTVAATGIPAPSYRWYRNDVEIPNAEAETLAIHSAKLTDAGMYTVKVYNKAGTVVSAPAALTVTGAIPGVTVISD